MRVTARAPGKLVLLGEYAVLDGATAVVMAVARYARACIEVADGGECRLTIAAGATEERVFASGAPSGASLVDTILAAAPPLRGWRGRLDSSEFFAAGTKLGLGSSAAALVAFAGAWWTAAGQAVPGPEALIDLHRRFQGGAGSGLDVATSWRGGLVEFRLEAGGMPRIGSVPPPNSVGFAGIFAGRSASTTDFVARYRGWQQASPAAANALVAEMATVAAAGSAAARTGDGAGFVAAMSTYGDCLERLGAAMGAELVTSEHREIGQLARGFDVAYKVSGAGGGDLGIAASVDREQLAAFAAAAGNAGFHVVELMLDEQGLVVEELV